METELPSGFGCSDECGCQHCLRLAEAFTIVETTRDRWRADYWALHERWSLLYGQHEAQAARLAALEAALAIEEQETDEMAARLAAVDEKGEGRGVNLGAQLEALTNQNRRYRIVQQYLVTALAAAEAHLLADFSANDPAYLQTRRALNVACEQAHAQLTRLDPAGMPSLGAAGEGREQSHAD